MYSASRATCRRHPRCDQNPSCSFTRIAVIRPGAIVDNQEVIYSAGNAVGLPGPQVLKRKAVLVDASQSGVEIGDDLLTTDNEDDVTRSGDDWTELAAAGRRDQK